MRKRRHNASALAAATAAMDAMYRAAAGDPPPQPLRAELPPKERRQKDRDSARRARRKGYPVGLTSPTLDRWWGETATTNAPTATAAAAAQQIATMSGEQAVAFFSRAGLPTGERPKQPRTPIKPAPNRRHPAHAFSPPILGKKTTPDFH